MTFSKTVHYNPPGTKLRTRCGLNLDHVQWRTDPADVDCNNCRRLIDRDAKRKERP